LLEGRGATGYIYMEILDMDLDRMVAQPLYLPLVSSPGSATG